MSTQPLHVNGWSCHRLVREGFTFTDGKWVKDKWSVTLHDDYVSVTHEDWTNDGQRGIAVNDISEALETIADAVGESI
jgi:hypothetical protein